MTAKQKFLMTQEEYDQLSEQLAYLKNEKTREIAEKINQARGYGDLSENSEYDAAKQEQAENAALILEYETKLKNAEIVEHDLTDLSTVNIGMVVTIKDAAGNEKKFELTGATANMFDTKNPKMSKDSPIGRAIIGRKKGETVEVDAPGGAMKITIEDISKKK
ncbi:MAG: transcription elongation factor GreA [Monoglobales bacterium]